MTQTMDLNKMGLFPLSDFEFQKINGGGFNPVGFIRDYVIGKIIDATWDAIVRQVELDKSRPNTTYNWNGSANWR